MLQPRVRPEGRGAAKTTGSKRKVTEGGDQVKKKAKGGTISRPTKTRHAMEPQGEIPIFFSIHTPERSPIRERAASRERFPTLKGIEFTMGDEHDRIIESPTLE